MNLEELKTKVEEIAKHHNNGANTNRYSVDILLSYLDVLEYKESRYLRKIQSDQTRRDYLQDLVERVLHTKHMHDTDILLGQLVGLLDIIKQDLVGDIQDADPRTST